MLPISNSQPTSFGSTAFARGCFVVNVLDFVDAGNDVLDIDELASRAVKAVWLKPIAFSDCSAPLVLAPLEYVLRVRVLECDTGSSCIVGTWPRELSELFGTAPALVYCVNMDDVPDDIEDRT